MSHNRQKPTYPHPPKQTHTHIHTANAHVSFPKILTKIIPILPFPSIPAPSPNPPHPKPSTTIPVFFSFFSLLFQRSPRPPASSPSLNHHANPQPQPQPPHHHLPPLHPQPSPLPYTRFIDPALFDRIRDLTCRDHPLDPKDTRAELYRPQTMYGQRTIKLCCVDAMTNKGRYRKRCVKCKLKGKRVVTFPLPCDFCGFCISSQSL